MGVARCTFQHMYKEDVFERSQVRLSAQTQKSVSCCAVNDGVRNYIYVHHAEVEGRSLCYKAALKGLGL